MKYEQKHQNDVIGIVFVFLLLTLDKSHVFSSVSIVNFEQVNVEVDVIDVFFGGFMVNFGHA